MTTVSLTAVSPTSALASVFDTPAGFTFVEVLISSRPDLQYAPSTRVRLPNGDTSMIVTGLNQSATYYAKARAWIGAVAQRWSVVTGFRTPLATARVIAPQAVMIEPAIIVRPEPVLRIQASSESAGYPATNLLRDSPVAFRQVATNNGDGTFSGSVSIDIGRAPIDTIALLNSNLPEDAVVTITSGSDFPPASDVTTLLNQVAFRASPNLPGRAGYHGLWQFAPTSNRHWKIAWRSTQQFVHIEYLAAGLSRATRNISVDKTETPLPSGSLDRRRSGNADRLDGLPMRRVEFELLNLTETQYETTYADLVYAQNDPILIVPNAKKGAFLHDRILFGALSGGRVSHVFGPRFANRSFQVDSLI